jgi:hypothetical protein
MKQGFPYTYVFHQEMILFFANEKIKRFFDEKSRDLEPNHPEYHQLVGVVLGFPPMAGKFFVDCMKNPDLQEKPAGFRYAGMNFIGNYDDLQEIAHWCWTKIPIAPEEIEVTYQGETFRLCPSQSENE